MKTAVLTGFQPFGKYVVNPTEILARDWDGKIIADHLIHSLVFPTTVLGLGAAVDYGEAIIAKAVAVNASAIVSLGIALEVKGVRVETECVNWVESDVYCTPLENRKPVFSDRAPHEKKCVPLEAWDWVDLFERLAAVGIPLEISDNAGSYCCNALMLRVLRALEGSSRRLPFLFAHVSCTEQAVSMVPDFDRVHKVLLHQKDLTTIVEKLLESYC
jgi:pyroglutamyl-peptidase